MRYFSYFAKRKKLLSSLIIFLLVPSVVHAAPTKISIPRLSLEAQVVPVQLTTDGAMEVPKDVKKVGWYALGAAPGEIGTAVLAGHVDNYIGPGIFFYLKRIRLGDEIMVYGEDGKKLTFTVFKKEVYPFNQAPVEEIFSAADGKYLNIITCDGRYDRRTENHEKRLVVYTKLKE
ncbi:class F sortase [Ectobacillus antri]|uniref:class F sortase n=1 Tax=Ectobacillus antri TaxID=2486280 RepID=UPI0036116233